MRLTVLVLLYLPSNTYLAVYLLMFSTSLSQCTKNRRTIGTTFITADTGTLRSTVNYAVISTLDATKCGTFSTTKCKTIVRTVHATIQPTNAGTFQPTYNTGT